MIWNFSNDCAQLCVAVAKHDTQAIFFSRRQCNDFTTIALPSPEKYCPCIRSFTLLLLLPILCLWQGVWTIWTTHKKYIRSILKSRKKLALKTTWT
jgi:hypothetical protein